MKINICLLIISFLLNACQNTVEKHTLAQPVLKEIPTPCQEGGEPNLFVSETGKVYLSYIEYQDDTTDVLMFTTLDNGKWSTPKTIASGSDWFVNWADFPSLVAYKDGGQSLATHWLQASAEGTFDYDVHIAQSLDAGQTWAPSFIPHTDGVAAEHGFVSMLPLSNDRIFATWLDGRNTKTEGQKQDGHGHGGAMTLRAATFDRQGKLHDEVELDDMVCDCCSTSAAITDKGVIVAYRNRTEDEIRDIYVIRQDNGKWSEPHPVFNDNWHIAGCPVNGASIGANGKDVAIVWFSAPDDQPQVKVAFSHDSGTNFSPPVRIDNGKPLGRVDVVLLSDNEVLISWMEATEKGAVIKAAKVDSKGKTGEDFVIAASKDSRQSGFPRMVKSGNQIVFAWTAVDSLTTVKTSLMDF